MTPNTQTSIGLSNSKPAPVDRAKQLATILLWGRGEASGAFVARELHRVLRALDADDRHGFQLYLATEFQTRQNGPAHGSGASSRRHHGGSRGRARAGRRSASAGAAAAHEHGAPAVPAR